MKKKVHWDVGTDDVGQSVLRWKVGRDDLRDADADPFERTYDFLKRLDVSSLSLEDEAAAAQAYDPYNTGTYNVRGLRREP